MEETCTKFIVRSGSGYPYNNEAHILDDIHKPVLSLHNRIDAIEDNMQKFMDSSFFARQSTPISSSHVATATSGSESAGSFQTQAEDHDFPEFPLKRLTDVLHGCLHLILVM